VDSTPNQCSSNVIYGGSATDNCAATVSTVSGIQNGSSFPVGTSNVTLRAVDASSNAVSCGFSVTVADAQGPTITCPPQQNVNTLPGVCYATPDYTVNYWDNCANAQLSQTGGLSSLCQHPLGTTTDSFQVTDASGRTSTCSFDVVVSDNQAPQLTCPGPVTQGTALGACSASVSFGFANTVENCAVSSSTSSPASGSTFAVGTTTVTQTAVDTSSNSGSCTFSVTVNDVEAPTVLTCPSNIEVNASSGQCGATVSWSEPTFSDNCGVVSTSTTGQASGSVFSIGTHSVSKTAVDAAGLSSTCSFTVRVVDNTPPVIGCPANIVMDRDGNMCVAAVSFTVPVGTDACAVSTAMTGGQGPQTNFSLGETLVQYTATDASGNTASCSFTVTVRDNNNPRITCPTDVWQANDAGLCKAVVSYAAPTTEDCVASTSGSHSAIGSGRNFSVGSHTEVYMVSNVLGVNASCSFVVTVNDTEAPSISCPSSVVMNNDNGECRAQVTYTAPVGGDNCGGSVTSLISGVGVLGYVNVNSYSEEVYEVVDGAGLRTRCSFNVSVFDVQAPNITCPGDQTVYTSSGACNATVTYSAPSVSDNCGVPTKTLTAGGASGSTFAIGPTTVSWEARDASDNTATCSFTVRVVDNEAPVLMCPTGLAHYGTSAGTCARVVTYSVEHTDNCGGSRHELVSGPSSGSSLSPGTYTVVWSSTDAANNNATCQFQYEIADEEIPRITCPTITSSGTDALVCSAVRSWSAPMVSDNCGTPAWSLTSLQGSGSTFSVGTTQVSYNVTDGAGNTQTCIASVVVEDREDPRITCPSNVAVSNAAGVCGQTVMFGMLSAVDNCGVSSLARSGGVANNSFVIVGTNWTDYTATDAAGNDVTCTVSIVVRDDEGPTISCPSTTTANAEINYCGANVTYSLPVSSDNCPGHMLSSTNGAYPGSFFSVGRTNVTYVAEDGGNLVAACTFEVVVNDTQAPLIGNFSFLDLSFPLVFVCYFFW